MPKVSIVIPVYGVEKYIKNCAIHLFEQTLDDIEYVFVDDCTPDKSIEIMRDVLQAYPHRMAQVRVLKHERNKGLCYARRTGYEAATGDFIISCDSDDWMDRTMCEKMYDTAISHKADVVWCNFYLSSGESRYVIDTQGLEDNYYLLKSFATGGKWGNIWSYLVARHLVKKPEIIWPEWNFGEDLTLTFQYVLYATKLKHLDEPLYYYRTDNNASYSNAKTVDKLMSNLYGDIQTLLVEVKALKMDKRFTSVIPFSLERLFMMRNRALYYFDNPKEAQRQWLKIAPNVGINHLMKSALTIKQKCILLLIYMRLFPLYRRFLPLERIRYTWQPYIERKFNRF